MTERMLRAELVRLGEQERRSAVEIAAQLGIPVAVVRAALAYLVLDVRVVCADAAGRYGLRTGR